MASIKMTLKTNANQNNQNNSPIITIDDSSAPATQAPQSQPHSLKPIQFLPIWTAPPDYNGNSPVLVSNEGNPMAVILTNKSKKAPANHIAVFFGG